MKSMNATFAGLLFVLAALISPQSAQARVTKITILNTSTPVCSGTAPNQVCHPNYEAVTGLADGVLDAGDPKNAIIQDIQHGKSADAKVHYTATFQLVKPIDMTTASGLMWQDVPNRGGRITIAPVERDFLDVGLSSGWQGDNQGGTLQSRTDNEWVHVPTATDNGATITGTVLARIVNRSGPGSQKLFVQANPFPYLPATRDTTKATLTARAHETMNGVVTVRQVLGSDEWAWASCTDWAHQTPSDTQICLRDGFQPTLLYQVVFTAKDPLLLGVGFAAFRDVGTFFKHEAADDFGTPSPLAVNGKSRIRRSIIRGVSQSGNYTRAFLHLGFNQDEKGRQVNDGAWPIIAGRRVALNFRWAQPDGVLELYEAGSEGPQWWAAYEDRVRGLPRRGILDRCRASHTCPKIIEHFGAAEVWELKLPIEWVGTDAKRDIPLPENVRRYYIPSSTHGGGSGAMDQDPPRTPVTCPGNNWGQAVLRANPVPHTETVNAIRVHFRNWVMRGTLPPQSVYPTLRGLRIERDGDDHERDGDDHESDGARDDHDRGPHTASGHFLVPPTNEAMGFPSGIPELPASVPGAATLTQFGNTVEVPFINPVLDYDWGPQFDPSDASGVPTNFPPPIKRVIKMLVPRVDSDGNELGGVPVVLRDAPLGSYFGWNITAANFHKDQNCDYVGGMVPFAKTKADRIANRDPRLSLEERYGNHAGYVAAVTAAAQRAVDAGFLLPADMAALIARAAASNVLNP
jgi:Alpha/beta hydrolase domain